MKETKEWFQTTELIGIAGLPKTTQGVNLKAKSDNWTRRKAEGIKGRAFEYHIDSFPKEVQKALTSRGTRGERVDQAETIQLPFYEVHASAGRGLAPIDEEASPYSIELHPQLLLDLGVSARNLFIMPIKGDSMEPTLFDGDIVIVRRELEFPRVLEGIYVIRIDNQVFIKRIQYNKFEGYMQVDSDNTFYRSFTIEGDDLNSVSIIGEAMLTLGRIRKLTAPTQAKDAATLIQNAERL
ncbi:S24 family peptidase [Vibrio sp. Vb0877]|uniref:helix-turn-helix domain-containing protein n=1 Tax=Vibrio sp. Vb0877 TaxID=2816073 RepID=UPI001A8EDB30|nr:S24 family peptidase [Vibrio sp. Vb0877]MBO0211517.1 LexA family transcriptional regulator [Vibrio sp. Vb0877]